MANIANVYLANTQPQLVHTVNELIVSVNALNAASVGPSNAVSVIVFTTSSTNTVLFDSFTLPNEVAEYFIHAEDTTNNTRQTETVVVAYDGAVPQFTEYGQLLTANTLLFNVDVELSGGSNINVYVIPTTTDTMNFVIYRIVPVIGPNGSILFADSAGFANTANSALFANTANTANGALFANTANTANDATYFNGEPASFYSVPNANTSVNGSVDITTQSFAGVKTFTSNTIFSGFINAASTLQVSGDTNLGSTVEVSGLASLANVNVAGNLNVAGLTTLTGNATLVGFANITQTLNVAGVTQLTGNTSIVGALTIESTLSTNGSIGSNAEVLTSNGGTPYWSVVSSLLQSVTVMLNDAQLSAGGDFLIVPAQGPNTVVLLQYVGMHQVTYTFEHINNENMNFYYSEASGANTSNGSNALTSAVGLQGSAAADRTFFVPPINTFVDVSVPATNLGSPINKNIVAVFTGLGVNTPNGGYLVIKAYYTIASDLM